MYGIYNQYTGEWWTKRGKPELYRTRKQAEVGVERGAKAWEKENGTELAAAECEVREYSRLFCLVFHKAFCNMHVVFYRDTEMVSDAVAERWAKKQLRQLHEVEKGEEMEWYIDAHHEVNESAPRLKNNDGCIDFEIDT